MSPIIVGVSTSVTAFVGKARRGPLTKPVHLASFTEYDALFGGLQASSEMGYAIQQFFLNGGRDAWIVRLGKDTSKWMQALDRVDLFNLLCLPGVTDPAVLANAVAYCKQRRAFLILDAPQGKTPGAMANVISSGTLPNTENGAVYYPWITIADPLNQNRPRACAPSGAVAGVYARTDSTHGVWKAPAGGEANLVGLQGVAHTLTDSENDLLNSLGVNCIRILPTGSIVVWGARTLQGGDQQGSEWKYVSVRRYAVFLEESIQRGTQWALFEPNAEPLWANIRRSVEDFMHNLFRQGALQGTRPEDAYFVRCDQATMTQADIDRSIVIILVGFAPIKPSEFTIIRIQQQAMPIARK